MATTVTFALPPDSKITTDGRSTNPPLGEPDPGEGAPLEDPLNPPPLTFPDISRAAMTDDEVADGAETWRIQLAKLSAIRGAWELLLANRLGEIDMD